MRRCDPLVLLVAALSVGVLYAQTGPFVSLTAEDRPFVSVLEGLADETGLTIQFDADSLAERTVTLNLEDVLAVSALKLACQAAGRGLEQTEDGAWLVTASKWGASPLEAARERVGAGDLQGAAEILDDCLNEEPGDLEMLLLAVDVSCRLRDLGRARDYLARAEKLDPQAHADRAAVEVARAHVSETDGIVPTAVEAYTAALEHDPNCLAAYLGRAKHLEMHYSHERALAGWNAYLERDPDSATADAIRLGCITIDDDRVKPGASSPAWSPDGARIAYVARLRGERAYEVRLRDVKSGVETVLIEARPEFMWCLDWSPDGESIAYEFRARDKDEYAAGKGIEVVDVATADIQRFEEPWAVYYPRWRPDGHEILTYVDEPHYSLVTLPFDIDEPRLQFQPLLGYTYCYADWSPDGKHIVASWNQVTGEGYALYLVDTEDAMAEHKALTPHDETSRIRAAYSPDGRLIAYLRSLEPYQYALYIMAADGSGEEMQLTTPPQEQVNAIWGFCWSPDGRRLAYSTFARELYVVTLGGLAEGDATE